MCVRALRVRTLCVCGGEIIDFHRLAYIHMHVSHALDHLFLLMQVACVWATLIYLCAALLNAEVCSTLNIVEYLFI